MNRDVLPLKSGRRSRDARRRACSPWELGLWKTPGPARMQLGCLQPVAQAQNPPDLAAFPALTQDELNSATTGCTNHKTMIRHGSPDSSRSGAPLGSFCDAGLHDARSEGIHRCPNWNPENGSAFGSAVHRLGKARNARSSVVVLGSVTCRSRRRHSLRKGAQTGPKSCSNKESAEGRPPARLAVASRRSRPVVRRRICAALDARRSFVPVVPPRGRWGQASAYST